MLGYWSTTVCVSVFVFLCPLILCPHAHAQNIHTYAHMHTWRDKRDLYTGILMFIEEFHRMLFLQQGSARVQLHKKKSDGTLKKTT